MTKKEQLKEAFTKIATELVNEVTDVEGILKYYSKSVEETVNELLKEVSMRTPLKEIKKED